MIDTAHETCKGCPTDRSAIFTRQHETADVAIVFEYPSSEAALKDDPLAGRSGGPSDLLRKTLANADIDLDSAYICSAVNCRPNTNKEAMLKKAMLSCRPRLVEELKRANVKKVLCLGTIGFSALMSAERNLPITKVRGKWHKAYGMDVLATFAPGFVLASPDWFRDYLDDLEKFATTDSAPVHPPVEVWVPETLKEVREAFAFVKEYDDHAIDLETTGLSPYTNKVLAAGIGVINQGDLSGTTVVLDEAILEKKQTWRLMSELLASEQESIFHNAKFDLQFLKRGFHLKSVKWAPRNIHDTMLLHFCLDERPMGRFKSHKLDTLARCMFDAPAYDIDVGKWLKAWETAQELDKREMRRRLHDYLGLDCYYTGRLFRPLWNKCVEEDPDLLNLYEDILMPGTMALADVELHGVLVDREFYEEVNEELKSREQKITARLQTMTGIPDLNPGSPQQVAKVLYEDMGLPVLKTSRRGKQKGGKTSREVLQKLKRKYPEHLDLIDTILDYRVVSKTRGTYAQGMLDRIEPDGRIRGNFNLHGTATGRISSDNPNLQNIPDSSHTGIEVRNGFIAGEGNVLIEADYSQLELRVAAWLSDDPDFKQVFIDDRDVHQEVTWSLFQKTREQASKYERYMAKCMNFGVMYMRGAQSLANGPEMDYIEDNGGIRWSEQEVKEFFDRMLDAWPRFKQWMQEQQDQVYADAYVKLPAGHRRRFPLIPPWDAGAAGRQAVNTPIQGTASHITLSALIRIHGRLPFGAHIVSTVHDSIQIEAPRELVNEVLAIVKEEMEDNVPFDPDVPFKSDADVAERWGQMSKWEWDPDDLSLTEIIVED